MRADDPAFVREQYATEAGLAARASIYGGDGTDARDIVLEELRRARPERLLEVGCGFGELAERISQELGCAVIAIDQSERMVALARERGIDAQVGDVQSLDFRDADFDAVVAAWMLYHVPDLDLALGECARVLRPGGTLVAVTNSADDLAELWGLVGRDLSVRLLTFRSETGEVALRRRFAEVVRHDVAWDVRFEDQGAVRRYVGSSAMGCGFVDAVPTIEEPFVARKLVSVFAATKARADTPGGRARPEPRRA
ncbi:class I SAM-dependent methyltransferase [Gaiella sp.]|uniref:class I SAM-dependent methyltransferase n=1 Tax=Gaiella sp. TaxID=2663207 RepID=UPI002E309B1E|nr:class I SAM-dependent methyltransferase [Gaiella sp.]HEX5585168.1 class I SAM-dependent methyltransferase [Gaiella sp.]